MSSVHPQEVLKEPTEEYLHLRFEARDITRLLGIPYRTFDGWIRKGVVSCEEPASGRGTRRRFTFKDVILIALAESLSTQLLSLENVGSIVAAVDQRWEEQGIRSLDIVFCTLSGKNDEAHIEFEEAGPFRLSTADGTEITLPGSQAELRVNWNGIGANAHALSPEDARLLLSSLPGSYLIIPLGIMVDVIVARIGEAGQPLLI